jgi:hypothetical protein
LTPVALPPGLAWLSTKPSFTGSSPTKNTIGTVEVAALAAIEHRRFYRGVPTRLAIRVWITPTPQSENFKDCAAPGFNRGQTEARADLIGWVQREASGRSSSLRVAMTKN